MKFLDSNVLVFAVDRHDLYKHEIAKNLLTKGFRGETSFGLSVQNLSEFFVVATQKISNPLSPRAAENIIRDFIQHKKFTIFAYSTQTVLKALKLKDQYSSPYWDSLIAAVMIENGVFEIYTDNVKDFGRIKPIEVINPFG